MLRLLSGTKLVCAESARTETVAPKRPRRIVPSCRNFASIEMNMIVFLNFRTNTIPFLETTLSNINAAIKCLKT